MQPVVLASDGVIRFQENPIVRAILDFATSKGMSLNDIALVDFRREDREHFAQLIGYSVSGFGELGYARPSTLAKADEAAEMILSTRKRKKR